MRRWLTLALCLCATIVSAQEAPRIYWDHDGANVTRFECVVDSGTPIDLGVPTPIGTTYSVTLASCPAILVNGAHTLVIQACNAGGCTASLAITVVKL